MDSAEHASRLHDDALIIDGLVWYSDGDRAELQAANVAAINLTVQVTDVEADFTTCLDDMARWLSQVDQPGSGWRIVRTASDITDAQAAGEIGCIMGWQNGRALEDRLERIEILHRLGLRIMQPTYNQRTFLADGCLETEDQGLSNLGRRWVAEMNRVGMAVDLSHSSDRTAVMAAEATAKPLLITHTGAKAVTPWQRSRSNHAMKAVAETGGVVGVSLYGPIVWNGDPARRPTLDDYRRHIDHVVDLVGIDHVGMGTDQYQAADRNAYADSLDTAQDDINPAAAAYSEAFGHTYRTRYPTDCETIADYPRITAMLLDSGWQDDDIRAFLGGNFLRVFRDIWGE